METVVQTSHDLEMQIASTKPVQLALGHSLTSLHATLHNGPGWRIGLWTQGCVHCCTNQCLNPHLLDPAGGRRFEIAAVHQAILSAADQSAVPVEGVTVLGGEPFEQAAAVAELMELLSADGLTTMVYSGHTWESLKRSPEPGIARLLKATDILVDGPFLPDFYDETIAWRGSSNQRVLCLSDRYTEQSLSEAFARQKKGFSIHIEAGTISFSGLQNAEAARAAESWLDDPLPTNLVASAPPRGDN